MGPRPDGTDALRRSAHRIQQGAEREQGRVSHDGVDPDYIQRLEHFGVLSHERIHDCVQAMDPGAMRALADLWTTVADNLSGAVSGLHMTMQGSLSEGLAGHMASAAEAATYDFIQQAVDVTEVAHSTGHRIEAAACAAEALRKAVPPPVDSPGAERDEQYQLALAAIEANYVPIYPAAGSRVPAFAPIDAGGEGIPVGVGAGDPIVSAVRTRTGPGSVATAYGGESLSATGELISEQTPGQPLVNPDGLAGQGRGSREPIPGDTAAIDPVATEFHSTTKDPITTAAGLGDTRTPAPATPGLPSSPGLDGAPGTPGGPLALDSRGLPGSSLTGSTTSQQFSGAPRTTPTTVGWTPSMYPPGTRGGAETDPAHKTPDWLLRAREEELLGTPPSTVAAVIGAEFPSAQPRPDATVEDNPSADPKR